MKVEEKALTYLSVGPIFSFVDGGSSSEATWALGLEASLDHYAVERIFSFGYGAFAQAQVVSGNDFRCALGGQASLGPAGIELGLAYRQNDAVNASTLSLQASFFLSAGYLYIAFRASPQIVSFGGGGEQGFGLETALTLGIKVPIAIQGRDPTGYAIQANGHAW